MKKTRKISTRRNATLLSIAALAFFVYSPSAMAEGGFKASVADFEAKRYAQALRGFEAFSAANRSDILSHYYIALCHQNMNHLPLALREYQWVAYYFADSSGKQISKSVGPLTTFNFAAMIDRAIAQLP